MWQVTLSYVVLLVPLVSSTTEWWGDLRAHLNPSRTPAFYDVTYDETESKLSEFAFGVGLLTEKSETPMLNRTYFALPFEISHL
ncbi:hypothetical protein ANCCEY_03427 [Ancylostoma ceylanicum]|uniref:Uncharacterized protein n=1 Tax=Ancylostoma ceylanicum TaxID=53326 RepID=A0A0D6M042_9BILA|nr:hypothetical protein ANCCEY_03427 [Ancylostoma ceylanicum]